jgi:hypothetical protein
LHEKGGKRYAMPCHHSLEEYLTAYLDVVGLRGDPKGPLFRTIGRGTGKLTRTVLPQANAYAMIGGGWHRDQARQPQFPGDRDHRLSQERRHAEKAAAMANHASTRTTQLYDRRREELSLDEVERIVI